MRQDRTNFNVEMVQRRYGQRSPNYNQVFHSFFNDDVEALFEDDFEEFSLADHI